MVRLNLKTKYTRMDPEANNPPPPPPTNNTTNGHNHHHQQQIANGHQHYQLYHTPRNHQNPRQTNQNSCAKCCCETLLLLRFFPFVMITALFIWGIYVYMYFIIYRGYESSLIGQIFIVIFFLPLYSLSYISYIRTVFAGNRPIPEEYSLPENLIDFNHTPDDEINRILEQTIQERGLPIYTRSYGGYVRYCRKCSVIKPDRCHHCSTCGKCIRKMDHHCHWVSNCVAYDNYKYFILFLGYTVLLAVYTVSTSLKQFIRFWKDDNYEGRFQVFFLVVFCSVFSLSILFLLSYHIYLICRNMSTLEAYQPPRFKLPDQDRFRFNLGVKRNFRAVFGDDPIYWFLPVPSHSFGDGLQFDLRLNPTPAQFDKTSSLFNQNSTSGGVCGTSGGGCGSATSAATPIMMAPSSGSSHYNHQEEV